MTRRLDARFAYGGRREERRMCRRSAGRLGVMPVNDDDALYRRFLDGDEDGLRALMDRYGNSLIFYINGYTRDLHDAEDLMIDVFSYLIVRRPAIRENGLKGYLYKAARNLALRFAEPRRKNRVFGFDDMSGEPESRELLDELYDRREERRVLHLCMGQLKAEYREALYLVFFQRMRHAEAAQIMGKSERQVSDLVFRGKKALKLLLEREDLNGAKHR